jgi:transcription elongation factor Elf1
MIVTVKRPPVNSSTFKRSRWAHVQCKRAHRLGSRWPLHRNDGSSCARTESLSASWFSTSTHQLLRADSEHRLEVRARRQHAFCSRDRVVSPSADGRTSRLTLHGCQVCGAMRTTSHALRRHDDNMYCKDARGSPFIQLSSLCHVDAQHARHVFAWRGIWVRAAIRKGGRMKYGTAPAFSMTPSSERLLCPRCQDLIIAATKSQHVNPNEVRHWWVCETCGHEFCTTVRWESSAFQTGAAFEKTLAQPL